MTDTSNEDTYIVKAAKKKEFFMIGHGQMVTGEITKSTRNMPIDEQRHFIRVYCSKKTAITDNADMFKEFGENVEIIPLKFDEEKYKRMKAEKAARRLE